jgi:phosphogluconate dehydratase
LLSAGILHGDVLTILGRGLDRFVVEPTLESGTLDWKPAVSESLDTEIVRPVANAFDKEGGLRLVKGNVGRAIAKVSAVSAEHHSITAKAIVFDSQDALTTAFQAGSLERDFVAVLPFQGARAVGMPELHKLTPYLGVLQNRGHKVALLTDGRMSGASGKVLAAIQVSPEAADGGVIGKIKTGDLISIDTTSGLLQVESNGDSIESRPLQHPDLNASHNGMGRELFTAFRQQTSSAESGATIFPQIR